MRTFHLNQSRFAAQKSALRNLLEKKRADLTQALEDDLREVGAWTAEALGARTFPSANAIGLAVAAMRFDFSRVYATYGKAWEILDAAAGKRVAGAFYAACKRGDFQRAREILRNSGAPIAGAIIGSPLDPALREKVRDKDGRVMTAHPLQIVSPDEFGAGIKIAIAEIGKTSSGWFACAEKLGGNGNAVPWKGTAKHGSDGGDIDLEITPFSVRLKLSNRRPLARKLLSPGQVDRIRVQARQMLKQQVATSIKDVA